MSRYLVYVAVVLINSAQGPTDFPSQKSQDRTYTTNSAIEQQSTIEHLPEYSLWCAVSQGNQEAVSQILQEPVNIHWGLYGCVDSILQAAFFNDHDEILTMLLEHSKKIGQTLYSIESIEVLIGFARRAGRSHSLNILEKYESFLRA